MSIPNCGVHMAADCLDDIIEEVAARAVSEVSTGGDEQGVVADALTRVIVASGISLEGIDELKLQRLFAARLASMFQCSPPDVTPATRNTTRRALMTLLLD
jgi:hypothetical protein